LQGLNAYTNDAKVPSIAIICAGKLCSKVTRRLSCSLVLTHGQLNRCLAT
jgi:hypothetical protein